MQVLQELMTRGIGLKEVFAFVEEAMIECATTGGDPSNLDDVRKAMQSRLERQHDLLQKAKRGDFDLFIQEWAKLAYSKIHENLASGVGPNPERPVGKLPEWHPETKKHGRKPKA